MTTMRQFARKFCPLAAWPMCGPPTGHPDEAAWQADYAKDIGRRQEQHLLLQRIFDAPLSASGFITYTDSR